MMEAPEYVRAFVENVFGSPAAHVNTVDVDVQPFPSVSWNGPVFVYELQRDKSQAYAWVGNDDDPSPRVIPEGPDVQSAAEAVESFIDQDLRAALAAAVSEFRQAASKDSVKTAVGVNGSEGWSIPLFDVGSYPRLFVPLEVNENTMIELGDSSVLATPARLGQDGLSIGTVITRLSSVSGAN